MPLFRPMKTLRKFASVHADVHRYFDLERRLVDRQTCKKRCSAVLTERQVRESWADVLKAETASLGAVRVRPTAPL